MKQKLSAAALQGMKRCGVETNQVVLAISTDIDLSGKREEQWLIVTAGAAGTLAEEILVIGEKSGVRRFRLDQVDAIRSQSVVGSALLQILHDSVWIDLIRYSNRLRHSFEQALLRLEQLRHSELPQGGGFEEAASRDPHRCPKCDLMLQFPGELCPRCISHGRAFVRVLEIIRPYWRSAAVLMTLLVSGIILDMVWPMLTRYLVDHVLTERSAGSAEPVEMLSGLTPREALLLVVAGLAGVHILRAGVNVITGKISSRVGNAVTFDVRSRLVQKLQRLGLSFYTRQETGSLVGRVAYDTEAVQSFINQVTSGFLTQILLVVFSFAMMFSLEPTLALWTLVPAPFVIGGAFVYWRFVHPHYQRFWDRTSKQAGLLSGILSGIRVVKAFAQEKTEFERFQKVSSRVRDSKDRVDRTAAYFYPVMGLVFQVGGWVIWYVGGISVLSDRISLGTLMAFFGYLSMFYGPLGNLTNLTTWLTQFSTQIHRIFEILDTPEVIPEVREPKGLAEARGLIEFDNVSFGYSRGAPVLNRISLSIRPGERVGIVGRSGSGKTSLINLICRFYDVESGQIRLDGVDLRDLSLHELRSQIAMVLQEPFLFRGTLTENIKYGRPEADFDSVIEASRAANAHDFVMSHTLAYDTTVGERGSELSGGERQRVSIARALLCKSSVLVLDEATSAIDSESEQAIQMALDEAAGERTTILIAHRLSTLQDCDRIFVIDHGAVAESGSHAELMRLNGSYARWVKIQQGRSGVEESADEASLSVKRAPGSDSGGHRVRWLKPGRDQLRAGPHGELQLILDGSDGRVERGVTAMRCLPVQAPESYISLRVQRGSRFHELGVVRHLGEWSVSDQELIRQALDRRYFFQQIERIHSIRKFGNFLEFTAKTDLGNSEFVVRYEQDSVQSYGSSGKLLTDVEDNHYLIPDLARLPDQGLFGRYVYW